MANVTSIVTAESMHFAENLDEIGLLTTLRRWRDEFPKMGVLVLLPEAERDAIPRLQVIFAAEGVPLAGAVFPALLVHDGFRTQGLWLLRLDEMPYAVLHPTLPRDVRGLPAAADAIVNGLKPHLGAARDVTLFMLFDAMVPNIGTLLDELYLRLANRVHYMGANAGSETFTPMPCLFDTDRIVQGAVLVMLLKHHRGAILEHGYRVPAKMITATSTEGNRILQIDWRPAFEVYQSMARLQYGVEINRENFYQYAVHFPFGIVRANGVILVRIPVTLEPDGSLFCVGEVPPNSVLALLQAPEVNSPHTLATLIEGLTRLNGPLAGKDLLLFYCAGRRLHLGLEAAARELHEFEHRTQAARVAGALSLGEIGSAAQWSYPLFHNAALIASRWGKE